MQTVDFPDVNNTDFPLALKAFNERIKQIYDGQKDKKLAKFYAFLSFHQFLTRSYIAKNRRQRGILIYHDMGVGKTRLAASLTELFREIEPKRKCVILAPKSLSQNFRKNLRYYMITIHKLSDAEADRLIDAKYRFVSLNAGNMFTQMQGVKKTKEELKFEKKLQHINGKIEETPDFLERTLLVIDEAHNFFNAICNGSRNAIALYDSIMRAKDIKIVFLTGTPCINNPFELVPCFNMIRGPLRMGRGGSEMTTLLPEIREDFEHYFIDEEKHIIKDSARGKFQNRIIGLTSYYSGNKKHFPRENPLKIEIVKMSDAQFDAYNDAREIEIEEDSRRFSRASGGRFSNKSAASGTYRIRSRQISDYLVPKYAYKTIVIDDPYAPKERGKTATRRVKVPDVERIELKDLKRLRHFSPKIERLIANLQRYRGLSIVYSEFVSANGLAVIARILEAYGFKNWNENTTRQLQDEFEVEDDEEKAPKKAGGAQQHQKQPQQNQHAKTFAMITGQTHTKDREEIVVQFNSNENKRGANISILLLSRAAAEGLDLRNVRYVHILEPFWSFSRIRQIITRAVRFHGHDSLPDNERVVQPFIYLSDYPESFNIKNAKELTTDLYIYSRAANNKKLIDNFMQVIKETAFDCEIHASGECRICSPTGEKLYENSIVKDMAQPDPCKLAKSKVTRAKEIVINGNTYYYTIVADEGAQKSVVPEIKVYEYSETMDGYLPIKKNDPVYAAILVRIIDL